MNPQFTPLPYTQSYQPSDGTRTLSCDATGIVNNHLFGAKRAYFMVSTDALYKSICNLPMAMPPELVCIALSAACCFVRNSDSSWTKPGNCCDGSRQAALQSMRQQCYINSNMLALAQHICNHRCATTFDDDDDDEPMIF